MNVRIDETMILKRWHIVLAFIFAIAGPAISLTASWYSKNDEIRQKISDVELNTEKQFVKKQDLHDLKISIDQLVKDMGEVKGYIKGISRRQ